MKNVIGKVLRFVIGVCVGMISFVGFYSIWIISKKMFQINPMTFLAVLKILGLMAANLIVFAYSGFGLMVAYVLLFDSGNNDIDNS